MASAVSVGGIQPVHLREMDVFGKTVPVWLFQPGDLSGSIGTFKRESGTFAETEWL